MMIEEENTVLDINAHDLLQVVVGIVAREHCAWKLGYSQSQERTENEQTAPTMKGTKLPTLYKGTFAPLVYI
jgi:hypothetical protein